MRRLRILRYMAFLVGAAGIWAGPVSAEINNRVVAIVNDNLVTLHELNRKIKEVTGLSPQELHEKGEEDYLEARRQILEILINEKITQEKIKEIGIAVTEKRVEAAIERIKQNNHWTQEDLLARLKEDGISYETYYDRMKRNLERMELIEFEVKSKIIIREEMIAQYYEAHKADFASAGRVHLAGIFLLTRTPEDRAAMRRLEQQGKEILARLKAGEDFGELAGRYSQGPGAGEGGDLGVFKTNQLDPELRTVLQAIPEGGNSDLIVRPNGIQIIKVIQKEAEKMRSLEEMRNAIYEILYQEEVNRRFMSWIKELRERSYTKIVF